MPDLGPFEKWFGYNRKERRASFILLLVTVLFLLARVLFPSSDTVVEDISGELMAAASSVNQDSLYGSYFDPNTASFDTLIRKGFDEQEASTLISYRKKGGRFRSAGDIKKVYGLEDSKAVRIMTMVRIGRDTSSRQQRRREVIELNSADSAALVSLPGIGPVLSARIVKYRNLIGGFATVDQLKEVYGLPPETFAKISSLVTADTTLLRQTDINSADYRVLSRIPYLERYEISSIMKYRELQEKISGLEELTANKILSPEKAVKIKPYLKF